MASGAASVLEGYPQASTAMFTLEDIKAFIGCAASCASLGALPANGSEDAKTLLFKTAQKSQELNVEKRKELVKFIGRMVATGDDEAYVHCVESLKDTSPEVKVLAVQALGKLGPTARRDVSEDAAWKIVELLEDPMPGVRGQAAQALGELHHQISQVATRLIQLKKKDTSLAVRAEAEKALDKLRSRDGAGSLQAAPEVVERNSGVLLHEKETISRAVDIAATLGKDIPYLGNVMQLLQKITDRCEGREECKGKLDKLRLWSKHVTTILEEGSGTDNSSEYPSLDEVCACLKGMHDDIENHYKQTLLKQFLTSPGLKMQLDKAHENMLDWLRLYDSGVGTRVFSQVLEIHAMQAEHSTAQEVKDKMAKEHESDTAALEQKLHERHKADQKNLSAMLLAENQMTSQTFAHAMVAEHNVAQKELGQKLSVAEKLLAERAEAGKVLAQKLEAERGVVQQQQKVIAQQDEAENVAAEKLKRLADDRAEDAKKFAETVAEERMAAKKELTDKKELWQKSAWQRKVKDMMAMVQDEMAQEVKDKMAKEHEQSAAALEQRLMNEHKTTQEKIQALQEQLLQEQISRKSAEEAAAEAAAAEAAATAAEAAASVQKAADEEAAADKAAEEWLSRATVQKIKERFQMERETVRLLELQIEEKKEGLEHCSLEHAKKKEGLELQIEKLAAEMAADRRDLADLRALRLGR